MRHQPTPRLAGERPASARPGAGVPLASLTTIGLGGPAPALYRVGSAAEVAEVLGGLDRHGGALVVGGGSNLIVADAGVDVPVVRIEIGGLDIRFPTDDGVPGGAGADAVARIGAGEDWDRTVAQLVADGWCGVETLAGIPGLAGATPIQNVGAYGTEIADILVDVQVYDRVSGRVRRLRPAELALGYRTSALRGTDRAVVTEVRIALSRTPRPVRYPELAALLGVGVGDPVPPGPVREAVLALRRAKGMVIDPADPDTRSAGSFFTNPILEDVQRAHVRDAVARRLGAGVAVPEYPAGPGRTKLSAAWLIERAGFTRGYPRAPGPRPEARIAISGKHTLALTNIGGGTTSELLSLAREIRDGVYDAFGVLLRPEPLLVGVDLDVPPSR